MIMELIPKKFFLLNFFQRFALILHENVSPHCDRENSDPDPKCPQPNPRDLGTCHFAWQKELFRCDEG